MMLRNRSGCSGMGAGVVIKEPRIVVEMRHAKWMCSAVIGSRRAEEAVRLQF